MDGERQDVIHQHSGWLIPLGFLLAILLLCSLLLAWYLRPGPGGGAPSGDAAPVILSVGGVRLAVPANYITTPAARAGGAQGALALAALLPDLRGYSAADARRFAGNAPDSPVVRLLLRNDPGGLDPAGRLARIYMPTVADPAGEAGPFGLTRYSFRSDSAYSRDDLFVGKGDNGLLLFLCERIEPALPSPNCLVAAAPPARDLGFSWRFKRAWLADWRQIAGDVDRLMARFAKS